MKLITTGDETRVYEYDVETKQEPSLQKSESSRRRKKRKCDRADLCMKTMLIVSFDC
jgi:hypothetical protein